MIDHHEAGAWADHHDAFSNWVVDAAHSIGEAFRVLARIQYHRPWACAPERRGRP